jgi:hypothetical protein
LQVGAAMCSAFSAAHRAAGDNAFALRRVC